MAICLVEFMSVQFEIESIVSIANRGYYVLARHLIPGQEFHITCKSFLGDVELVDYIDIPRAINEKGEQRTDLFSFHIKNPEDNKKLAKNQIAELLPGNSIHCLIPWHFTDTDFTKQLEREINSKHILFGKKVKTIARRQDNDDVLFEVENASFKYAMVHLTWAQTILRDSIFPRTITYTDWIDAYENRIVKDNNDWED